MSEPSKDYNLPYKGLTSEEVKANRSQYGANVLTPPEHEPWWKLYLEKFNDPVIRILMIAAGIAIAVGIFKGEYVEGLGIIIAILLATGLAFFNEYKANQEFELLNQVYDQVSVKVIRDQSFSLIPRKDLVVGDIVYVEQGEEVPADGILLESVSLFIDQSKITGESEPVAKYPPNHAELARIKEFTYSPSNLYRSTIVSQGHGFLEIKAVGDRTEIGQLAKAIATVENEQMTPLNQQLEELSQLIGVIGLSVSALTFLALFVRGLITGELSLSYQQGYVVVLIIISVLTVLSHVWLPVMLDGLELAHFEPKIPHWLEKIKYQLVSSWLSSTTMGLVILTLGVGMGYPFNLIPDLSQGLIPGKVGLSLLNYFMVAVTIIVVAVPEGLPMSVTLSLAYSMKKMAASNNLVRKMHACETIGAATVICSDKTGTLTCNQMRVDEVDFPCLKGQNAEKSVYYQKLLAEAIAVNSTADLERKPQQAPSPIGNPTESALLLWLDAQNLDYIAYRHQFETKAQMAFSTEKKYMGTFGKSRVMDGNILYIKGAPEVVLLRCSQILTAEGLQRLAERATIVAKLRDYQERGMRTLGFAYYSLPDYQHFDLKEVEHDLIWLGFAVIADPLRLEVPQAIKSCLSAGIKVKIVTGDSSQTAQEIGRQIGLLSENNGHKQHLSAQEFNDMNDEDAREAVKYLTVMSRACPLDKLRLVKLLQDNGEVVCVTGDGTNDAAALKQAQVGLAMGSGTAIAKEASDIILLDDAFTSIVNAVVWGRSLYDNIQRFILFQLTINVVALGTALLGPFIGIELPLTVTQMLWVNLIMDTFAALALATEPPHWKVMERLPRDAQAFIISPVMTQNILTTGLSFLGFLIGFLIYLRQDGVVSEYELSVFFAVFVLLQFWNLFNARCLGLTQSALAGLSKNRIFLAIAATIVIGQILIIQFGGTVFRTEALSFLDWVQIIAGTSIVLWIGEILRWWQRRK